LTESFAITIFTLPSPAPPHGAGEREGEVHPMFYIVIGVLYIGIGVAFIIHGTG
jgi:hypothetical protein